jgi:CRP-like cAMP-binding protein
VQKNDIIETLKNNLVFEGFSDSEYAQIAPLFEPISIAPDITFIAQDDPSTDLFIITQGSVAVLKKDSSDHFHQISTLTSEDMIGEIAFFDKSPRSASVKTLEPTTVLKLNVDQLDVALQDPAIYKKLYHNLAKHFSLRLRHTNDTVVASLQSDLKRARMQINMGNLMVTTLVILTLFIFSLNLIQYFSTHMTDTTVITLPVLIVVLIALSVNMRISGYPLSFYGITFENSRTAVTEAVLYTLPLLGLMTFIKWIAIQIIPSLSGEPLFQMAAIFTKTRTELTMLDFVPLAYVLLSSPIQELIFRGTLQASLKEFLIGKHHVGLSIFVSNLLFALIHIAVSMVLSAFAFVIGLFWGWLYNKHKTLFGVVISHMIIGGWAFFVLGIQSIMMHS